MVVEAAVRLTAEGGIVKGQADQFARRAEQGVDRNVEDLREQLERLGIGDGLARLPAGDRLPRDKELIGKRVLRQAAVSHSHNMAKKG